MRARLHRSAVTVAALLACGPDAPSSDGGTSGSTGSESGSSTMVDSSSSTGDDGGDRMALPTNRDAAILFVIDDSATMAAAQSRLALAGAALWSPLASAGANLRIGFTTTDNGNPWCGSTTPESGALVASSCHARLADFALGDPPMDASAQACTDVCSLPQLELAPTTTGRDPEAKPRPWLEWGVNTNLPANVTLTDAFACTAPQGIAGCGFESLLESMYLALERSEQSDDPAYGFVEDAAVLAVVLVSDETDCSYADAWSSIFLPADEGGDPSVFWSDPTAPAPTSAVCWNAGVVCTGGPSVYDECHAVNKDVAGNGGASDDDAVLRPIARYVNRLQAIEDAKQAGSPDQQIVVAAIGGVPVGYESGAAEIMWAPAEDPAQQDDFGIGPGCLDALGGFAVPPVREREVAEAHAIGDARPVYSICAPDYSGALGQIAERIVDQLSLACAPVCVADTDAGPIGVQPTCTIWQEVPGQEDVEVPPCNGDELPNGIDVCWIARVDPDGSQTKRLWDNMSSRCVAQGWNLEVDVRRREGAPLPPGGAITFECTPSPNPAVDCPNLP